MTRHFRPSHGRKPNDANRVRIIGGEWRSRVIEFPDVEGLRPTANRVRETLFNWLGQTLHGKRCLDLFAGSGALGFEAASRGAAEVVMVENNRVAIMALEQNLKKLVAPQCRLISQNATEFLATNRKKFDVAFLDPPFGSGLMPILLGQLEKHLSLNGEVYVEWGEPIEALVSTIPKCDWHLAKHGKAGVVHFGLLSIGKGTT
jgi:16S rRNA (guanine(966)-N(2))-methyltransferase RsmD